MKDKRKLIILYGFPRGGTSIVWNILQSHPEVYAPRYESKEILAYLLPPNRFGLGPIYRRILDKKLPLPVIPAAIQLRLIRKRIEFYMTQRHKLEGNDERYQGVPYTLSEIDDCHIVMKSLAPDLQLNLFLEKVFTDFDIYYIGLVRNGYAICEGFVRRGFEIEYIGKMFANTIATMLSNQDTKNKHLIIKFEDVLDDPFAMSEQLFQFLEISTTQLDELRFLSKAIVSADGDLNTFGVERQKYWFNRTTIKDFIVPEQSLIQAEKLSNEQRDLFNQYAGKAMLQIGYDAN